MKNIFIIGAQSTGKTTIVNSIEKTLTQHDAPISIACKGQKPAIIKEVARNVLKAHKFSREDITASRDRAFQLQKHILSAQFKAEDAVSRQSPSSWYITDRSGLDPIVYTSMFVGEVAVQELLASPEWHVLEGRMKNGLVFLCEAGTQWLTDDGIRLMPTDEKEWFGVDRCFRHLLEARKLEYVVISKHLKDKNARVATVTEALLHSVAE